MSALREIARRADPTLARYAVADPPQGEWEARFDGSPRGFVFETVFEAFQLHYGTPRAFEGMDDELRLLAGDALYALALEELAERGDLAAIGELADLISLASVARAEGREPLVKELWEASAEALSNGGGPGASAAVARADKRRGS